MLSDVLPMADGTTEKRLRAKQSELATLIARHTGADGTHDTEIGPLTLTRSARPSGPLHLLQGTALCIVAQGRKKLLLAGETYLYDSKQCLVASFDLPVVAKVLDATPEAPYLGLQIDLPPAEVATAMAEYGLDGDSKTLKPSRGLSLRPASPSLLGAAERLVRLLERPEDTKALAPLVFREILYRLLSGRHGALARQIATADSRLQAVTQAIDWLKQHYADPFEMETLTHKAGMSRSALHRHFKAVTAMTPLQYQKELRLREARRLMLGQGLNASMAARRVGYASPSQFTREYKRLFGAPPTRDIAQLKGH